MYEPKNIVGYCGVYCGTCAGSQFNRTKQNLARELKRLVDVHRDGDWIPNVIRTFDFVEFRKGLEFYTEMSCPGCRFLEVTEGEDWCERRKCATGKGVHTCFECDEIETCEPMTYIRETYPFVLDRYFRIFREKGLEGVLEEMEGDRNKGFEICDHLARTHCKRIDLKEPPQKPEERKE
jgi:hypothetical protein